MGDEQPDEQTNINVPDELYHGSSHKISKLEPRATRVLEGDKAVFATNSKVMAVIFIPKWTDCDFQLGVHDDRVYAIENYPKAFDLLKVKNDYGVAGYLYTVSSKGFESDERLGMRHHEFINKEEVDITRTELIDNVYEYLINSPDISMITYDQMIDAVFEAGLI
jgi:hypothetical protein